MRYGWLVRSARQVCAARVLVGIVVLVCVLAPRADAAVRAPATGDTAAGGSPAGAPAAAAQAEATFVRVTIALPVEFPPMVNAYVVRRGDEAAIVDTGIPGSADAIGEALRSVGLEWAAVRHVILTHYHPDHASGAPEVLARAPQAELWIGAADIPLLRLTAARPAYDGDDIFGLQVLSTPGHTPGHSSLLDPGTGTLLTGDAVWNLGGTLSGSPPQFTWDGTLATASVLRLGALAFERAFVGHGEPIERGAAAAIRQLGAGLP